MKIFIRHINRIWKGRYGQTSKRSLSVMVAAFVATIFALALANPASATNGPSGGGTGTRDNTGVITFTVTASGLEPTDNVTSVGDYLLLYNGNQLDEKVTDAQGNITFSNEQVSGVSSAATSFTVSIEHRRRGGIELPEVTVVVTNTQPTDTNTPTTSSSSPTNTGSSTPPKSSPIVVTPCCDTVIVTPTKTHHGGAGNPGGGSHNGGTPLASTGPWKSQELVLFGLVAIAIGTCMTVVFRYKWKHGKHSQRFII